MLLGCKGFREKREVRRTEKQQSGEKSKAGERIERGKWGRKAGSSCLLQCYPGKKSTQGERET